MFKIQTKLKPKGDQPQAIRKLSSWINTGNKHQTLLGVTGSGKTFTVANVIARTQRPTLVIAHNKTLAAQLTQEFRDLFPENAVEYFVSYYDYYQPEAYIPNSDTYIEKEATVNEEIDRLRNAATQSILSRNDVIVVASVSCIYGLGSPEYYQQFVLSIKIGQKKNRFQVMRRLLDLQFIRSEAEKTRGSFSAVGNNLEVIPADKEIIYRIRFEDDIISKITILHSVNRNTIEELDHLDIFPAKHYLIPEDLRERALLQIERDLERQLKKFRKEGKILEAERLSQRTNYDLEMIREVGYCNGIENYSRYFDGRKPGDAPYTLVDYFRQAYGNKFLIVVDESHVTIPQIGAMYEGDRSRKDSLVNFGFRLPAAYDNRPLKFDEFEKKSGQMLYMSATPAKYERRKSGNNIAEQIIRPTGLVDPKVDIRPVDNQIDNLIGEIKLRALEKERTLVTTLTKKMAEDLTKFLEEKEIKVRYLHSDVETIDRIKILESLRKGDFDVLVGVNLLREGLDLPEVSLVAILDADKEGFLRSETSLIQTIGRAARNINGRVIFYADHITGSMRRAVIETDRRREAQIKYNKRHGITPRTIEKEIRSIAKNVIKLELDDVEKNLSESDMKLLIAEKEARMKEAAKELRFEEAAILRDQIIELKKSSKFFRKVR